MCAGSSGKIGDKKCSIYMGYYGGSLRIGDALYTVDTADRERECMSETEMIDYMTKNYTAQEIATMIVQMVRDSDE